MSNILITGGKGLIGSHLSKFLSEKGFRICILSRHPGKDSEFKEYKWSPNENYIDPEAIKNADIIIHLAGAGIADKRWTESRKKELYDSRTETAKLIFNKCVELDHFPEKFISASGIGIYGADSGPRLQSEDQQELGNDFISNLTKGWEKATFLFKKKNVEVTCLRTGMVLARDGGAIPKLSLPVKFGLGAALGGGTQYISWIHIEDLCNMYLYIIENNLTGRFNAVASQPVTNKKFMKLLSENLSRPYFMPNVPSLLLKIGLGELSEILLGGNNVSNEKILKEGFVFKYPNLTSALKNL